MERRSRGIIVSSDKQSSGNGRSAQRRPSGSQTSHATPDSRSKYSARRPGLAERAAYHVTDWVGSSAAFVIALLVIIIWAVTGPIFDYSSNWQLVINTGTTIVTFLMVFLIQRSQNKESLALQLKLNELIAAVEGASSRLIDIESLSEHEVKALHHHYQHLVKLAREEGQLTDSHTIEEAVDRHRLKDQKRSR